MSSTGRAKVVVDVEANVAQISNSLKGVQQNLSKLKLPASFEKNFNSIFSQLEKEITNFRAKANAPITSTSDMSKIQGSWEKILDLYRRLGVQVQNLNTLSQSQKNALVPGDLATRVEKVDKAVKEYTQSVEAHERALVKYNSQITTTERQLENFKKELAEIKGTKNVVSPEEFEELQKAAEAAKEEVAEAKAALDALDTPRRSEKTGKVDRRTTAGKKYTEAERKLAAAQAKAGAAEKAVGGAISSGDSGYSDVASQIAAAEVQLAKFQKELQRLKQNGTSTAFETLKTQLKEVTGEDYSAVQSFEDLNSILQKLYSESGTQFQKKLEELVAGLREVDGPADETRGKLDEASLSLKELTAQADEIDQLKNRLVSFFSIGGLVQTFRSAIRSAYESVKELDAAMTETAVVTDYSISDMWAKLPETTEMANKYGTTLAGVYDTMTLYYQQGLNTAQATELGAETLKMARIAGLDYATATDYIKHVA